MTQKVYAIVVHDPQDRGYDVLASDATDIGSYTSLYVSNPVEVGKRDLEDPDFEAWVVSHGELLRVLNADDEPFSDEEWLRIATDFAGRVLRHVSDLVDFDAWQHHNSEAILALERCLDAWDEFVQTVNPEED